MARVATSQRLQRTIHLAVGPLAAASERFITHPQVAEIYPAYLVSLLAVMRGILAVMEVGRQRAEALAAHDPVAAGIVPYLGRHLDEERGHEAWVLEDLRTLGRDEAAHAASGPSFAIAKLIGCQYYWTFHAHPIAILGYLSVAEGRPTSPLTVQRLQEATGLPRAAFRTLFEHAELDGSHRDELAEAIDKLPLTNEHELLLGVSATATATLMAEVLDEVSGSAS